MAAFLHFIAADVTAVGDDERAVRALISDAQLGATYPINRPITFTTGTGPDGTIGVTFADTRTSSAGDVRYHADSQTWQRRPGEPVVHVGFIKDKRPTPDDLQRDAVLEGHRVELGDGAPWLCPVARTFEPGDDEQAPWRIALPQRAGIDAEGRWKQAEIVPECSDLWADAEKWFAFINGGASEPAELTLEFMYDASLRALSANYRIGKIETVLLGLFDNYRAQRVLNALIDWPTVAEWSKKNNETDGPTRDG